MHRRAVLTTQGLLLIAQSALTLELLRQFFPASWRKIYFGGNIELNHFLAAAITQYADQSVIHFNEPALRRGKENSFLNIVEQFSIAALCFQAVGDVLENVH